jgi:hypothetical protein
MNLRDAGHYQKYKAAVADARAIMGRPPCYPPLSSLLCGHAALEAANYVMTGSTFTVNKLLSLYLPTMEFSFNEVLRTPGCDACSSCPERDASELYFEMGSLLKGEGDASANGRKAPQQ